DAVASLMEQRAQELRALETFYLDFWRQGMKILTAQQVEDAMALRVEQRINLLDLLANSTP
ncbi:hypothetical protein, partial [Frankia sp. AgB32]|uniref:hypothetical protein n=1 Tax=Frankia sp. AgB32 TaxID=631119 RepID=UPI00200D6074